MWPTKRVDLESRWQVSWIVCLHYLLSIDYLHLFDFICLNLHYYHFNSVNYFSVCAEIRKLKARCWETDNCKPDAFIRLDYSLFLIDLSSREVTQRAGHVYTALGEPATAESLVTTIDGVYDLQSAVVRNGGLSLPLPPHQKFLHTAL